MANLTFITKSKKHSNHRLMTTKQYPNITLFAPAGANCAPCHVFVNICANTRTSVLKNLTFPKYEFGKGNYAFYPIKIFRFAENKIKFIRNPKLS